MRALLIFLGLSTAAAAQEGALDVLDGETLYEDGWLLTLGYESRLKEGLLEGRDRVSDPLDRRQIDQAVVASGHYGWLHTLQVGIIAPYVSRTLTQDDPTGPDRFSAEGPGDVTLYGKWRYYRWDASHRAMNFAVLGGLELPTGSDDERDHDVLLPIDLQPGSGSWDPFVGTAATFEPYRWRFNALVLYKRNGEGGHDYKLGDQFFAELAAGNRFWLEPYPGPFMRADVALRHRHEGRNVQDGDTLSDTGGDLTTLGVNWAFRPQPVFDIQLSVEVPIYQDLNGLQLKDKLSTFLAIGYRF